MVGVVWSAAYLRVLALKLPGHTGNLNAFQTGMLPTGKPILASRRFAELGHFVTDNLGASGYHGGFLWPAAPGTGAGRCPWRIRGRKR